MGDFGVKKIFTILCALMLSVTLFAGCNLTTLNKAKYYKTVVVTVEGDENHKSYNKKYTREDLMDAFYTYSYSNVNSGSVSAEDGLKTAMDSMIDKDLLVNFIKTEYFDKGILTLTEEDKNNIRYEVFSYIQKQIYAHENTVREEWDRVLTHDHDDSETSSDENKSLRAEYIPYTASIEPVYDESNNVTGFVNVEAKDGTNVKFAVPEKLQDFIHKTDEDVSAEAYARYVSQLQKVAKNSGKSTKEADVINAEIDKLTKAFTDNKYMSIYQDWYTKSQKFVDVNGVQTLKNNVIDSVLTEYKKQYASQKKLYASANGGEEAYHKAMAGDDVSTVYYHPDYGNGAEYMYVSHILIKFSDGQKKVVENLKSELKNGTISQKYYDAKMQEIIDRTPVTYEENGVTKTSNAQSVYEKVTNYVNGNAGDTDYEKKAELFNEMIYMFNDDEGIMNKDFAYVVNLDANVTDKMVKEFADGCRKLNSEKGVGGMDKVVSEYGIHIIFHAGLVTSADPEGMTSQELLNALVSHKTQLSSQKTLFNLVYDSLNSSSADSRSMDMVEQAKGYVTVTVYTKKYKSLLKN